MQIIIAAIGKFRKGPELALFEQYSERLAWKLLLKEYEVKKNVAGEQRMALEAQLLLEGCKGSDHVVALDEKGSEWGSAAFAAHLRRRRDAGDRSLAFVIGGADGLHESVKARAGTTLAFGRMTWPHMLVRGLLAEQLYRACCILQNHPYHRE